MSQAEAHYKQRMCYLGSGPTHAVLRQLEAREIRSAATVRVL